MDRAAVKRSLEQGIAGVGVNPACFNVKFIPAFVEATVLVGGRVVKLELASGSTEEDVASAVDRVRRVFAERVRDGQSDIEDFTSAGK